MVMCEWKVKRSCLCLFLLVLSLPSSSFVLLRLCRLFCSDLLQNADSFCAEGESLPMVPTGHSSLHFADVMHLVEVSLEQVCV